MGFGILFVGYILSFFVSLVNYGYIIRLAGYALMAIALIKIREYGREFTYPLIGSLILTAYGIYDVIYQGAGLLSIKLPDVMQNAAGVMSIVNIVLIVAFNLALLWAIYSITRRLELFKQRNAAVRNAIFIVLYFILNVLGMGPLKSNEIYTKYFGLPTLLLQLAWIILVAILIFSCYMYICPEGDEDMPRHRSKFDFVNKMADESDRRMEQAGRDTQEYIKKKQQEKLERLEKKGGKKK